MNQKERQGLAIARDDPRPNNRLFTHHHIIIINNDVADSKVIRLPTLRELIGYPTTYYDDYRINTSPSSILLHLLRNDVDNDISRQNVVKKESFGGTNELQDDEKVLVQLPRNVNEETGDSWLRQASENKVRSRSPKQEDIIGNIDERVSVTNAIREDEREQKKLSTSMYLKPTTMRGIPLASLTPNPVTRGFYVTRSENDLISQTSVRNFTSSYTTESLIEQQTETTLTLDISTTDESFTIAQNDQNGSISQISNDDVNDIVTDETATIVSLNDQNKLKFNNPDGNINGIINNKSVDTREEKYSGSSVISSEDSDNDENISDYEETDVIIAPVSRSTSKRRKSLRNFDSNTTPLSNAHVFSSTTPTRRKIALVVRKYNEATTPLWTARRVVARKRSRTTVSPIKDAIKQAESNSIRAITNIKSASTIPAIVTFRKRKRPATSTIPTIPLIMSESITSSKIFNIRDDLANSTDTKNDDPISHITGEEMITTTDSQNAAQITSTTDNPTTIITSTILNDPTTLTIHKIPSASIITTTPSTVAVAETPTDATDAIIMTTYATMSAGIETTFVATNYSVIPIPAIIHANDSVVRSASTNIGAETTSVIANYSTDFIDTTPVTTDVTASTGVETTFAITNNSIVTSKIADTNTIVTDSTDTFATTDTEIETTSAIANSRVVTIPETVSTQAVTTDPAITTTPVTTNTGIEIISIMTNHSVVATPTVDTHESATDFTDMTTEEIASIEVDTTFTAANYSMVTIPVTLNTPDVVTNPTITTTLAAANTEIETTSTIANYSATIPETTNTHATTPISATTITPLTTVISSTTDTHTHANTPMIRVDLADTDTLVTDTITVTTPANVIVPTTDSDVITTPSSTSIPHSNTTSPIIDTFTTTTQSRTISTNPSKAPITSTDTTSTTPTTLTDESSTVHFINPNIIDVSGKLLTAIAESTQTTEMSTTFEISPTSTTIAISEFLPNTNSEISALTTSLSTQTDESSVTMTTQTPSTLLSLLTPITNTVTVGLEKSTVSSALPATSSESIATNFVIQTFASTYEPDSMRITNKESTTPELIGLEKDTSRATQNRAESRATTSIYESSNTRTMSEESTTPELKINLEKATSWIAQSRTESRTTTGIYEPSTARMTSEPMTSEMKVNSTENTLDGIQIRRQNQTTSEPDTTGYQFGEKTFQRRVINRTKNWNGRPVAQQTINQYPRRRITVYRGRPRRPPNTSSSKIVEQNRRRRIMQRRVRVNSKAVNSTITPESIVRNITEDHTDRLENTRRRMKVVLKRVREKVEEETTTLLPIKETTTFSQSSTENETLPIYHANGNIDRKRKVLKRIRPQPQENVVKEEISINPDSNSERHSDNSQNDSLGVHEDLLQQEKMKKRMRVVLKSIRPKSEGKNLIKETNVDSDIIDEYLQNNFSRNPHTDENLPDKGNTRRRMRVVLKSVKPKSNEKNPTIEETNADSHVTVKNLQDTFVNNLNTSTNLPDEEKTRGRKRIILKRVRPKSEEGETTTKEATTDLDSTEETLQGTFSNNFRENLPVEYKTRRRMRVVLKNIKPITEERISTGEEADVDSDSTNKDLQGSFSSNFHENFSDKEKTRIRTEVIPSNNKSIFKETDSIAEETNTDSEFTKKDPRVLYTFNFSSNLQVGGNLPDKEKTTRSNSEEEEATTGQPKDTELLITGTPVVLVDEDTDRPSLEATSSKNSGPVRRQPGSGNSSRQRKPTQSTTIVPPTNTLPSTSTTQRRRRPTESTLSSRIDHFVDAFKGTEPYTKLTTTENDQEADVSDQSIHAQEFAVTLADPPSSSSDTGRTTLKDSVGRKISTTIAPRTGPATSTTVSRYGADYRNRQRSKTIDRPTINVTTRPRKPPVIDYDYYEDEVPIVIGKSVLNSKLFLTSKGTIHCLDQGNFPHPYSCKKFITCARMVNGQVIGTEYTCPAKLSFDPVGGICNWSAGLGCKD